MKYLILCLLLISCNSDSNYSLDPRLKQIGTCFRFSTNDYGKPAEVYFDHKIIGVGKDGITYCQIAVDKNNNISLFEEDWYSCGTTDSWKVLSWYEAKVIDCPTDKVKK